MVNYYSGNIADRTKLWFGGSPKANVCVPNVLFLPTVAVKLLGLDQQSLTPFECYTIIRDYIDGPSTNLSVSDWTLVLSWFMTANQGVNATKKSHIRIETRSVVNDDEDFKAWTDTRLLGPFGPRPASHAVTSNMIMQPQFGTTFRKDLGRAVAQGLTKAAPRLSNYDDKSKKEKAKYSADEWAHIMAFAGVDHARKVPAIWIHFGKTKFTRDPGNSTFFEEKTKLLFVTSPLSKNGK